jgi:cell division initiation protein
MRISPIDIQQKQFKSRPFGYEKAGVDQFLEVLAEELERLIRQNQDLREELARTAATLHEMREREEILKTTLVTTQRVTEELKATARREVDVMMAEAELKAERLMYSAEERRQQLIDEIQEIKRQKIDFEVSLRGLLEKHIRMLELNSVAIEQQNADARLIEESMPYAESPDQEAVDEFERDDESPEEVARGSEPKVSSGSDSDSNLQELIFEFDPESDSDDEASQK